MVQSGPDPSDWLPETVSDQIRLWESEMPRNRIRETDATIFENFARCESFSLFFSSPIAAPLHCHVHVALPLYL